jgi:hypothetical protein
MPMVVTSQLWHASTAAADDDENHCEKKRKRKRKSAGGTRHSAINAKATADYPGDKTTQ